jgi:hypothetical protein
LGGDAEQRAFTAAAMNTLQCKPYLPLKSFFNL